MQPRYWAAKKCKAHTWEAEKTIGELNLAMISLGDVSARNKFPPLYLHQTIFISLLNNHNTIMKSAILRINNI
jgi:hypothetical protein